MKHSLFNHLGYVSSESITQLQKLNDQGQSDQNKKLSVIGDLVRYNTLLSVARAGTGHLGASLSMIEILTEIYFRSFNMSPLNMRSDDRDVFFLSKGHGVPALYAILAAKGYFETDKLNSLRRLNGLPGHCDIEIPGVEANTGSLAMGLSKAVGCALFKKRFKRQGSVVVVAGNGELQEGQCWESFLSAVSFRLDNLYIIIDDNEVQTDRYTEDIVKYGNIIESVRSLGFYISESDGKKFPLIQKAFINAKSIRNKPKLLFFKTNKGQGVSFMEHAHVLKKKRDRYIWHNKAPDKTELKKALTEIIERNKQILNKADFSWNIEDVLNNIPIIPVQSNINGTSVIKGFSEGLVEAGRKYNNFVVIDCDLEEDCGFIDFHRKFPGRFFEMGIMEQHAASVASAISRSGEIPVLASYAAFLTSRSNEQLYNLASEGGKALIIGNMSGVIPATPGKSHQAFRDIACIKNIPKIMIYQPVSYDECKRAVLEYFKGKFGNILYLRISLAASSVLLTNSEIPEKGHPTILRKGTDVLIIGIGPVVLGECMKAAEKLKTMNGINAEVWSYPFITEFDRDFMLEVSERKLPLIIVEDHYRLGGFGESFFAKLLSENIYFTKSVHISLDDYPRTGFRDETLEYLGLNSEKIFNTVSSLF